MNKPRDWTAQELAQAAGVTDARIRQLLIKGKIKGHKLAATWFIPNTEARRWLAQRELKEESPPDVSGSK